MNHDSASTKCQSGGYFPTAQAISGQESGRPFGGCPFHLAGSCRLCEATDDVRASIMLYLIEPIIRAGEDLSSLHWQNCEIDRNFRTGALNRYAQIPQKRRFFCESALSRKKSLRSPKPCAARLWRLFILSEAGPRPPVELPPAKSGQLVFFSYLTS